MKRLINIFVALLILLMSFDVAQARKNDDHTIIGYLVNPTQHERQLLEGLTLYQLNYALSLYDSEGLVDQLRAIKQELNGLELELSEISNQRSATVPKVDTLRTMIINQIQLLRMTGEQRNIDKIMFMVSRLIESDPSDITFMKPYLDVKFQTGEWDECDRVLGLFEANCKDEYDYARILQNRASVANGRNQMPLSLELFKKSLAIYDKYVEKEGWGYKGVATRLMTAYNIMSQQYFKLEEKDSCIYYMNKVLAIGDIAMRYDSIDAPLAFASACNSIANKFNSYNDAVKADSVYAIAYKYIEQSYKKAPFRNGSTYAFYYMNHARDNMSKDDYESAVKNSEKALDVMTRLYRVFPKWSAVNYFEALRLRAELYTLTNDPDRGFNMLKDAEAELDEIEMDSPNSNQLRYYSLYYDFAINKATCEQLDESISYFQKAKDVVRDLDPRIRDRNVALCDKYIELFTKAIKGEEP